MDIKIRQGLESDFPGIMELVKELAIFQGSPELVQNSLSLMIEEKNYFHCLVAENDQKEIVGMAIWSFAYYSWVGKSMYLDDLVVKESYRGQKAGSLLLNALFEIARKENCKRVRWLVSEWNKAAIDFYRKCGAHFETNTIICDFDRQAIGEFMLSPSK